MTMMRQTIFGLALLLAATDALAASCCGGGGAATLLLPKMSRAMVDTTIAYERYDGFWDHNGKWKADPVGSKLSQTRLDLGLGYRLADRWQASITLPYVRNSNHYGGINSNTSGLGDATVGFWYETFDNIMCVWDVQTLEDLKPAVYLGGSLTVPTGISPFDNVTNNFDITGRGFYRLDANLLLDKTIYPWTVAFSASYGVHIERPVNQEYGTPVAPYRKKPGNRLNLSLSGGHTLFTDDMQSLTLTTAYADLWEDKGTLNGTTDNLSGMRKRSVSLTAAVSSADRDWVARLGINHSLKQNNFGRNFPTTDTISLGVSHVFR